MPRVAKKIICSEEDHIALLKIVRSQKSEQRLARRARMVLGCNYRQIHKRHCYAAK